ncbi:hypothetical protein DIRU0_E33716 [Diutina rugosa]
MAFFCDQSRCAGWGRGWWTQGRLSAGCIGGSSVCNPDGNYCGGCPFPNRQWNDEGAICPSTPPLIDRCWRPPCHHVPHLLADAETRAWQPYLPTIVSFRIGQRGRAVGGRPATSAEPDNLFGFGVHLAPARGCGKFPGLFTCLSTPIYGV